MERTAFGIYVFVLGWSVLLFGAFYTYVYTVVIIGVLAATLLLIRKSIRKDIKTGFYQFDILSHPLNLLFLLFLGYLIFQLVPLPDDLLKAVSLKAWVVGEKSLPAVPSLGPNKSQTPWFSAAPYLFPVRTALILWITYWLFTIGLSRVLNSRKRIELFVLIVLGLACFEVIYGLQSYSKYYYIWWYKKTAHAEYATGTFQNYNHFAGLMEMCLMLAAGYAAALADTKRTGGRPVGWELNWRARLSRFIQSKERRISKRSLIVFAGVVIGLGLLFSASRGGIISGAVGLLCMGGIFLFKREHRRKGLVVLVLFLITSIYGMRLGVERPLERFSSFDMGIEDRIKIASKGMDLFRDYKVTGVGVGNFRFAYPQYQAPEHSRYMITHAHSDWVQLLIEAGIVGLVMLCAGGIYYLYLTIRLWKERHDPFCVCLGAVPIGALAAIGTHSLSDFNLHIPSNFLMLAAVTAVGHSALHLERRHAREKMRYQYLSLPLRYKGGAVLAVLLGLILLAGVYSVRHFMAEAYCATEFDDTLLRDRNPSLRKIQKAAEWDGWNAEYHYKKAMRQMVINAAVHKTIGAGPSEPKETAEDIPELEEWLKKGEQNQRQIIEALESAVRLNPFEAEYHLRLGWQYTSLWRDPEYHRKWLPAADVSMERAAHFAGAVNPYLHVELGNYWVMRSKTLTPASTSWSQALARASWHYRNALSLVSKPEQKQTIEQIRKAVWAHYPDEEMVREILE